MNYAALVERDFGVTPIRLSPVALLNEDSYSDLLVAARKVLLNKGDAPQAIADLPDGSKVAVGSAFCALLSGGAARVAGAVFGESLTEAAPTLVSAPKSQRDKLLTGTGTAKITPRIYAWAVRKFAGEDDYTVTPIKTALMKQRIEITRPYGLDKSRTITVVPVGDYLKVTDDDGKPGNRREQTFDFAEALEEAAKLPRKPKLLKTVGPWEILHYANDRSMYVRAKGGTEPEFEVEVNTPSFADDEMTYDLLAWDAKSKKWEPTSPRMLPPNVYAAIGKLWVEMNAPSESEEPTDESTTTSLTEMEIGKKDRAVLLAFAAKRAADGHKLDTDGKQLDGLWMGGRNIATWVGDRVVFNDLGSKAAQTVQNALRKVLNPIDMKESLDESSRPRESDYTAIDNVTDDKAAHLAAIVRDAGYSGGGIENAMEQANDVIDGFGVEAIKGDGPGGYWQDTVLLYVNLGDTYDTTLCYDTNKKRFFVGDWGGWVEEFGDRYKVESMDEGSVRTPALVFQLYNASGGTVSTASEWRVSGRGANTPGMGKATDANLKKAIELHNASLEPGGANDHLASMGDRVRAVGGIIRKNGPQGEILVRVGKLPSNVGESLEEADQSVAKEILRQLGGNMFATMTGAKGFLFSDNSLTFKVGRNSKSVTAVSITLDPSDTYTVKFFTRGGKEKATVSDVYADNLRIVFTTHTGLETSLGRMRESLEERVSVSRLIAELVGDEGEVAVRGIKLMGAQKWFDKHAKMYLSNPLNYTQVAPDDYDATPHVVTHGGKAYMMFVGEDFVSIYATRPGGGGSGPKESLDEMRAVTIKKSDKIKSFADLVAANLKQKAGQGTAKITPAVHAWAEKKFLKSGRSASMTNVATAVSDQKIEINLAHGSMGSRTITITPAGDVLRVTDNQGGGIDVKGKTDFYTVEESLDEATTGWRTTDSGHHIYLNKGAITKGNPHLLRAAAQEIGNDDDELSRFFGGETVSKAKGGKGGKGGWLANLMSVFKRGGGKDESLIGGPLADFVSAAGGDALDESVVKQKHARMMRGEVVVVSYEDMSELENLPNWKNLVSRPNPKQVGTKDIYIAWYKDKKSDESELDESVPGLAKWLTFAGGTGAAEGKMSYQFNTANGQYHIWPVSNTQGKHIGYHLKFANQPKEGGKYLGQGLWIDLGRHRAPAAAARAARQHDAEISGQATQESLNEASGADDDEIIKGMARALYTSWWADEQEQSGTKSWGAGTDIEHVAPATSKSAMAAAKKLAARFSSMNDGMSLTDLYKKAEDAGFFARRNSGSDYLRSPETTFGFLLAMRALGHGVGWDDNIPVSSKATIKHPHTEYYESLEGSDEFVVEAEDRKAAMPKPGDIGIESMGNDIRIWQFTTATKLSSIARSNVMLGQRALHWFNPESTPPGAKSIMPAEDFTKAKLYGGSRSKGQAEGVVKKYLGHLMSGDTQVHLFYAGRGPSGRMGGFGLGDGTAHFTLFADSSRLIEAKKAKTPTLVMVGKDGEEWRGSVDDFIKSNRDDAEMVAIARKMMSSWKTGKSVEKQVGGGAQPIYTLRMESIDEALINVRVTANTGDTWVTQINGTMATAKDYFLGKTFNIGIAGRDKMVRVTKVEPLDKDAEPEVAEGWRRGRAIDPDEYPPIKGMEGPFMGKNGRVVYYDPKEGRYYDRKTDIYLDRDDSPFESMREGRAGYRRMGFGSVTATPHTETMGDFTTAYELEDENYDTKETTVIGYAAPAGKKWTLLTTDGESIGEFASLKDGVRQLRKKAIGEAAEAANEGTYGANDPSPFDPPEVAKAKAAARDAEMKAMKRAADAARGPAEKLAATLTADERKVLGVTVGYIASARRKQSKLSQDAYDAAVKSLKAKGLLNSQGALSPSTRDMMRALDISARKELFGESIEEQTDETPATAAQANYDEAPKGVAETGRCQQCAYSRKTEDENEVYCSRFDFTAKSYGACDAWQDAKTWEESLTEAAKLDTVLSMVLATEKWVLKKTEALPLSAPVSLQLTKMLFALKDALRPHFAKTGREAVALFVDAMNEVGFQGSVPPMHTLGKKWNLDYDKYASRYTMPKGDA